MTDSLVCCPCKNRSPLKDYPGVGIVCNNNLCPHNQKENAFMVVNGIPILIAPDICDTVCDVNFYSSSSGVEYVKRSAGLFKEIITTYLSFSVEITRLNCRKFLVEIGKLSRKPKVLIIGSGTRGVGADLLWSDPLIYRVGIDIYPSESVNYIADAHYLPFVDSSFDGVWVQAVLEHVVDPNAVAIEINRVLKMGGTLYSEIPFMQYVHEGAYDFTRFTVLGHRYLFKNFEALTFGPIGNAADTLNWALRGYIYGLTGSKLIAKIITLPFSLLLKIFSGLVSKESQWENSTGSYFLGKKSDNLRSDNLLTHKNLIKLYKKI